MKKKIDNPIWCILHALYLLRYMFIGGVMLCVFLWMIYAWAAGVGC